MSSRPVPTIDFSHPPTGAETSGSMARTDGSDHKLKQQLKDAGTIMSCVVVHGRAHLEARPYPRNAQGVAIALRDLKDYAATHTWLDNVHCFCESMFGTAPRPVHIITPSRGSWAKHVVLGCQEWRATGKAERGKREFCLYWLDLTELVPTPRFAHHLQLQTFPLRAHSYVGANPHGPDHIIRQILGGSGGPSSSQESGAATSSQGSTTMGAGSRASLASHSRQHSTASNDSTVVIPFKPIERKKPKRQLFPKKAPAAVANRLKPGPGPLVTPAKAAALLPSPPIEISDDEPQASGPTAQRVKHAKAGGALPGPVIEVSDGETPPPPTQRVKPAQTRTSLPAPATRKRSAVDDAEAIVVSDDDARVGVAGVKTTTTKAPKRQRVGHMSTRTQRAHMPSAGSSSQGARSAVAAARVAGGEGVVGTAGSSSQSVNVAAGAPSSSELDVFTVDGQAPGSQGAAFVATTSSVTGERVIYMLAGKKEM